MEQRTRGRCCAGLCKGDLDVESIHAPLLYLTVAALAVFAVGPAGAVNVNFTDDDPGNSNWNDPDNWSPPSVPNNVGANSFDVFVDNDHGNTRQVVVNGDFMINSLTIDTGDSASHVNGDQLTITLGGVSNDGQILVNGAKTDRSNRSKQQSNRSRRSKGDREQRNRSRRSRMRTV